MLLAFASLTQLVLCVIATFRCAQERWLLGLAGGALRITLLAVSALAVLSSPFSFVPGLGHRPAVVSGGLAFAALIAAIAGPLTSFTVTALAWRRTSNLPAAQEQRASRPLRAWILVAAIDAIFVVLQLGALVIGRDY